MDRSHIQGTASLPKHKDKIAMDAPVPMRHMNRLGATNLQQNPNGVGAVSKESKVNGGDRKTW